MAVRSKSKAAAYHIRRALSPHWLGACARFSPAAASTLGARALPTQPPAVQRIRCAPPLGPPKLKFGEEPLPNPSDQIGAAGAA